MQTNKELDKRFSYIYGGGMTEVMHKLTHAQHLTHLMKLLNVCSTKTK